MKASIKRKNYYLDENKIQRAKRVLGAKTETETIDRALDMVLFRKELIESLQKASRAGGVEKVF